MAIFCELRLQLRGGQPAALEAITRLDDFLDVELEDVAPARCSPCARSRRRRNAPSRRPHSRSARVISLRISSYSAMASLDSLVNGTQTEAMWTKITIGPGRQRAARLGQAVVAPGGVEHRLEDRAGRLLVEQRHAVGEADDARELAIVLLVARPSASGTASFCWSGCADSGPRAVGQTGLDHERVTAIHGRRPADGGVEVALDLLVEAARGSLARRSATGSSVGGAMILVSWMAL